jgi:hypothetical protein
VNIAPVNIAPVNIAPVNIAPVNHIVTDQATDESATIALPTNDIPTNDISSQSYVNFVKKVKKDNITPDNIGEILLSQIPGISSVTAQAIMKLYPSFPRLIQELEKNPECLNNTSYLLNGKSRKISKACIESVKRYLIDTPITQVTSMV